MVLPRPPENNPTPNTPFYFPQTNSLQGPAGPLVIGSGLEVTLGGALIATGGGGGSTAGVTSIVAGTNISISSSGPGGTGTVTVNSNLTGVVTAVTAALPLTSSGGTTPQIFIDAASTLNSGAVQLNDTTVSSAVNLALTANQGRVLQNQINSLLTAGNTVLAGTINASNGLVASITLSGAAKGFAVGSNLPAAVPGNESYFVLVTTPGSFTPPGGVVTAFNNGDWVLSTGTAWVRLPVGSSSPPASTTVPGIVELATNAETQTGTDATTAVTPAGLQSKISDSTSLASSNTIASSQAIKTTFDIANAALPKAGGTMTGNITFVNDQPVDGGSY